MSDEARHIARAYCECNTWTRCGACKLRDMVNEAEDQYHALERAAIEFYVSHELVEDSLTGGNPRATMEDHNALVDRFEQAGKLLREELGAELKIALRDADLGKAKACPARERSKA